MFVVQFQVDGDKVNLTLVEELVARYRFDLDSPLPEGEGDPWAVAEQWVTDSEVLPDYAPELGTLTQCCNNNIFVIGIFKTLTRSLLFT